MMKVINRGKRSNTLSEVKSVKNVSLVISPVQREVLPLYKLQDHAYGHMPIIH